MARDTPHDELMAAATVRGNRGTFADELIHFDRVWTDHVALVNKDRLSEAMRISSSKARILRT